MIIATSLQDFINNIQKEIQENKQKTEKHLEEIRTAPNNTVQMPQVKTSAVAQQVQQPVIKQRVVIPPKKGGCGCWGNK